jgi:isoquinoline 1-oxidoreductase beta subunit
MKLKTGRPQTTDQIDLNRRHAIQSGGLAIAFLWLGGSGIASAAINARRQPGDAAAALADGNPAFAPNAFIRIGTDGTVRLVMPTVEMGQAIYTGSSMLLAEELGVGLDQISVEHSPPSDDLYGMPLLGGQITGGSTSTRGTWQVLREAGAVARTLLVTAAARSGMSTRRHARWTGAWFTTSHRAAALASARWPRRQASCRCRTRCS